ALWKKCEEMQRKERYKYRIAGGSNGKEREKIPTVVILDEEGQEVTKIANK
ncbi:22492_t:CDS:2, partial [Gigaspora rosea]